MVTIARKLPSLRAESGVMVTSAIIWAPADFKSIGIDLGLTFHPPGNSSRTSPATGPVDVLTLTETDFALSLGKTNAEFAKFAKTGGTMTSDSCTSPATGST